MFLLATDLDGTFLGGSDDDKKKLYSFFDDRDQKILVYVTGRGLKSVTPLMDSGQIPVPDYLICDVGASVIDGSSLETFDDVQKFVSASWPGTEQVKHRLQKISWLKWQEVPQNGRCSYFFNDQTDLSELYEEVNAMGCDLILSNGRFADVLPRGVNKGSTLNKLIDKLQVAHEDVLVAGDTLNDLSLYQQTYKGVVVGQAEEKLVIATKNSPHVFQASAAGAGGILQAIGYFEEFAGLADDLIALPGETGA